MRYLKVTVVRRFVGRDSASGYFIDDGSYTRVIKEFAFGPFCGNSVSEMCARLRSMISPPFELRFYSLSEEEFKEEPETVSPEFIQDFLNHVVAEVN